MLWGAADLQATGSPFVGAFFCVSSKVARGAFFFSSFFHRCSTFSVSHVLRKIGKLFLNDILTTLCSFGLIFEVWHFLEHRKDC